MVRKINKFTKSNLPIKNYKCEKKKIKINRKKI
jgi:hypothetical protein